jgi:hypothetical protein
MLGLIRRENVVKAAIFADNDDRVLDGRSGISIATFAMLLFPRPLLAGYRAAYRILTNRQGHKPPA